MTLGLAFWIIMLVWLVFGLYGAYNAGGSPYMIGGTLLMFVLFLLLGWHAFGPPLHS
jgi:hypothetical protein